MAILAERRTYVAGNWVTGNAVVGVENPADESHVGDVTETPVEQVGHAIAEAQRSFGDGVWADLPGTDRARVLHELIDFIEANAEPLVATMVAEAGQSARFAEMA